jgi:hypothetical protein
VFRAGKGTDTTLENTQEWLMLGGGYLRLELMPKEEIADVIEGCSMEGDRDNELGALQECTLNCWAINFGHYPVFYKLGNVT